MSQRSSAFAFLLVALVFPALAAGLSRPRGVRARMSRSQPPAFPTARGASAGGASAGGTSAGGARPGGASTGGATAFALGLLTSTQAGATEPTVAAISSALAAYGHYLGLLVVTAALVTERLSVKEGMSEEDFDRAANADIAYFVGGLLVLGTGYLRVTQYGKGVDFYVHEPIFWVKLALFVVMGSASYFPTIQLARRAITKRLSASEGGPAFPAPLSPKLIKRMTSVLNAELLAVGSIPLAATLMARGVGYADWLSWQLGAAPVALIAVGLGGKYVKEALDWTEDE